MSNYFTLKNQSILTPPAGTNLGTIDNKYANVYVGNQLTVGTTTVDGSSFGTIKISSIDYPGDDTAANTAGGQTITITGSGFVSGASVIIDNVIVGVVTVVSSTQITFISPAKAAGSYSLFVVNPDGATATFAVGIQFSGVPTWITSAGSISTLYEGESVNTQLVATGDAPIIYSLASGSLPSGVSLFGNGLISGITNTLDNSTTYNFAVKASDYQNQDTDRAFSYTVNPDIVTFNFPSSNQTYSNITGSSFSLTLDASSSSGKSITYTANILPTGLSLSGANITGTISTEGSTTSLITATAVDSGKTSTLLLNWVVSSPITPTVEYLVVAGGGGGGAAYAGVSGEGGGGGAGGVLTGSASITPNTYVVTVGAGGAAGAGGTSQAQQGSAGTSSSVFGISSYPGGGGGATSATNGQNAPSGTWGSGGGGGGGRSPWGTGAAGTPGQGYSGGGGSQYNSGGGGGAGGTATDMYGAPRLDGGIGITSNISGSSINYAGGGGGAGQNGSGVPGGNGTPDTRRAGGLYGGGIGWSNASPYSVEANRPGLVNTGGGGGGSNAYGYGSGTGGSGIVIIRYPDTFAAAISTTGNPTITVTGGYRIYKFTSSGSITF